MLGKGSPKSNISTVVGISPIQKVKFSRKFVIDLEENKEPQEITELNKRILKYKKRYRKKKNKLNDQLVKNQQLALKLENCQIDLNSLKKSLENEFSLTETLLCQNTQVEKDLKTCQENAKLANTKAVFNQTEFEELQEQLFTSGKKATDLERQLPKIQKKNEGLSKDLNLLKIELSSKLSQVK